MIFPAYCRDLSTGGTVYIPRRDGFSPQVHAYMLPVKVETQAEIQALPTNQEKFMALKTKGWVFLNKEEKELYQQLKLSFSKSDVESI